VSWNPALWMDECQGQAMASGGGSTWATPGAGLLDRRLAGLLEAPLSRSAGALQAETRTASPGAPRSLDM